MIGSRRFERHYRSVKVRPDPLMEFVLGWLRRHPLPASDREAPIAWDSGQFHHVTGTSWPWSTWSSVISATR